MNRPNDSSDEERFPQFTVSLSLLFLGLTVKPELRSDHVNQFLNKGLDFPLKMIGKLHTNNWRGPEKPVGDFRRHIQESSGYSTLSLS